LTDYVPALRSESNANCQLAAALSRSVVQGGEQAESAEQEGHRGGHDKQHGRNVQWCQRSLIKVRFERPH